MYYSFLIYKNKTLSKTSRLSSSRAPLTLLAYRWVLYMCLRFTIKMDFDMKRSLERSMQPMVILITRQLLTRRGDRHVEHNCINMMVLRIKFRSLCKKKMREKIAYKRRQKSTWNQITDLFLTIHCFVAIMAILKFVLLFFCAAVALADKHCYAVSPFCPLFILAVILILISCFNLNILKID